MMTQTLKLKSATRTIEALKSSQLLDKERIQFDGAENFQAFQSLHSTQLLLVCKALLL